MNLSKRIVLMSSQFLLELFTEVKKEKVDLTNLLPKLLTHYQP